MGSAYSYNTLKDITLNILLEAGVSQGDSKTIADSLLEAELRGVKTHGLIRLETYLDRMDRGGLNRHPIVKVLMDSGATALLDGDNCCGQVAGKIGMLKAIAKAEKFGIGFVGVRKSNHFGIASYYSLMAAERNMIGFALSNASPRMAPTGGASRVLGNNPFSVAFPVENDNPIAVDMAVSVVAAGKIRLAAAKNEKIPMDWALDEDGIPTDDPDKALKGFLLPIGGHKGYGLSLLVDLLSGLLTGSAFGKYVGNIDQQELPQNEGHIFGAIKIANFMDRTEYCDKVIQYLSDLKSGKKAANIQQIFVPGEIENRNKNKALADGIILFEEVVNTMNRLCEKYGLTKLL